MGTPYWVSPAELFARAFEAYIDYILNLKDRKNNYLVAYPKGSDTPYPSGKELEKIVLLFDNIFKEFKKEFNIGGFKPFTTERENEYIEFDKPKDKQPKESKNKIEEEVINIDEKEKTIKKETDSEKKQVYLDKIEIYEEMIADTNDKNEKQKYQDKIDIYKEMINDIE